MSSVSSAASIAARQRLGVVRDETRRRGAARELDAPGTDDDLLASRGRRGRPRRRAPTSPSGAASSPSRHGTDTPSSCIGAAGSASSMHVDPLQQVAELVLAEHLLQPRAVGRRRARARPGSQSSGRSRRIVASSFDCARLVGVLAQRLPARGRELVDVLEDVLERAVLRDQLAGGLVPEAGDARDVVRGVALEADEVRDLLGGDPVAGVDALWRVDVDVGDAARGHHQARRSR